MSKLLIVIDMQNDFITGSLGTKEAEAIVPNVINKIKEYQEHGYKILFTKDTHYNNYLDTLEGKNLPIKHCIINTHGWEYIDSIVNTVGVLDTIYKSSFGYDEWESLLESIIQDVDFTEIELVGVCTDICVISNALIIKSVLPNTKITVDASCCAGTTLEKHRMALEIMKGCQINITGE